ncbi:hypothetical protein [Caldivirga maquilingensis]|nr:hypothetical protein [Caldivirga maquilingensis]
MTVVNLRGYLYSPCLILYPRLCLGYRVSNLTLLNVKVKSNTMIKLTA